MTKKQAVSKMQKTVYAPEYKAEEVKFALEGPSVAQAARDLGISEKTLHGWVAAPKTARGAGTTVDAMKVANAEITRLRRDLARAQQEGDFFARSQDAERAGAFFRRYPK